MAKTDAHIVIRAEDAVFWMDAQGRWCNAHGRFRHKRTLDYLNRCIGHDPQGWFVRQRREGLWEKVYFNCPDTALFVVDVEVAQRVLMTLNTGRHLWLKPRCLLIRDDSLYQMEGATRIKFTERAAAKLMPLIEEGEHQWFIRVRGRRYRIGQANALADRSPR